MQHKGLGVLGITAALIGTMLSGAEGDAAALQLRIVPNESLRYAWTIATTSQSHGKERGRDFTLSTEVNYTMTLLLRGLPPKREGPPPTPAAPPLADARGSEGANVAVRIQDFTYSDKRAIGDAKAEVSVSRGHVKCTENGKVIVDSDNDIGADRMADYQRYMRNMESAELRVFLDQAGRQSKPEGDAILVDALKAGGAEGIFPILAGKTARAGESWESSFKLPQVGGFRLAQPAVVRSKMTFSKWVAKAGKDLAQIDVTSRWETRELKGENDSGLLVEFSQVDGGGTGSCLFDPATGRFAEGALETATKYRIDGERDGQTTGLDVVGKTRFTFTAVP